MAYLLCKPAFCAGNCPCLITLWPGLDGGHCPSLSSFLLFTRPHIRPPFSPSIVTHYTSHVHKHTQTSSIHPLVHPVISLAIQLSIGSSIQTSQNPSCQVKVLVTQLCLTLCDLMDYCLPQGGLPDLGIKPGSLALQADSLPSEPPGKPIIPYAHIKIWCTISIHPSLHLSIHLPIYPPICLSTYTFIHKSIYDPSSHAFFIFTYLLTLYIKTHLLIHLFPNINLCLC